MSNGMPTATAQVAMLVTLTLCSSVLCKIERQVDDIVYYRFSGNSRLLQTNTSYLIKQDLVVVMSDSDSLYAIYDEDRIKQTINENWEVLKRRIPQNTDIIRHDVGGFYLMKYDDTISFADTDSSIGLYDAETQKAINLIKPKINKLVSTYYGGPGKRINDSLLLFKYSKWVESSSEALKERSTSHEDIRERAANRNRMNVEIFKSHQRYVLETYGTDFGIQIKSPH